MPAGTQTIDADVLNRWCAEGMRSVKLSDVQTLRFSNPVIETEFRRALEIARSQSARLFELRAACDLTRLRRAQGRLAEARDLLAPVYASFTEGFAFPDLVEARALLEELGAAPAGGPDHGRYQAPMPRGPDNIQP